MFGTFLNTSDPAFSANLRRLEGEMDQLMGRSAYPTGLRAVPRGTFPPINIGATQERIDVFLFAAGIDPKSIEVSIQQNLLSVSGSRKVTANPHAEYYRRERFDGEFHRVITLPDDVDPERVDAKYVNGVLQVTVQRRQPARPRQVNVQ